MTANDARALAAVSGSRMMHGGYADAVSLDPTTRLVTDAIIDTIIPPEEGWPSSAELGIADLLARYLVPDDAPVALYPYFRAEEFPELAARIGGPLVGAEIEERVGALQVVETEEPELFARIRDAVYYLYYGHSAVVALIRSTTRYGADYLGGSQPTGYRGVLESWGSRTFTNRGVFIPTASVRRAPQAVKEDA